MSDYNQCLPVVEAVQRCSRLDEEGLYWIEEPTTANDYEGNAIISRGARTTDPDQRKLARVLKPKGR